MPDTTTAEVPHGVNNFYVRTLLERAVPAFIHTRFAQIRDIPKGNTDVIKFRRYGNLAAQTTPLTEGITPAGKKLSVSNITATVKQYGDYVTLTDKLQFTTLDPILTETAEILGDQSGDSIDQLARDILAAGTTIQYASTATSRGAVTAAMKFDATEAKEAVRTLKNNKARKITSMVNPSTGFNTIPINAAYISFVHPNTTFDLKSATGWIPVEKYPNKSDVMPNEVGALDEIRFIESPNCKVFSGEGSGGIDVYGTLIFGANSYGNTRISGEALRNIIKALGSAGTADPLEQRSTSGWKATFVALILNQSWLLRVEHAVSG